MELGASAVERRGFTFIEVMFSVMILGFGVIMVAIMIPVAIRQTQETRDTNAGNAIVESGFHNLETVWSSYGSVGQGQSRAGVLPSTNWLGNLATPPADYRGPYVVTYPAYGWNDPWNDGLNDADNDTFSDAQEVAAGTNPNDNTSFPRTDVGLMGETLGNRIESMSAQTAWIPFYAREGTLFPYVALVGVRVRNVDALGPGHFYRPPGPPTATAHLDNCPLPVNVTFTYDAVPRSDGGADKLEMDRVDLSVPTTAATLYANYDKLLEQAAVEGAVLVLVNDGGQIRILTLGKPVPNEPLAWQLAAGGDTRIRSDLTDPLNPVITPGTKEFDEATDSAVPYRGYLIGRMLKNPVRDPADPTLGWDEIDNPYIGATQVVQILQGKMLR